MTSSLKQAAADQSAGGQRPLIFDVGMHNGDDTDFYLKKGFDVVAIDADLRHVQKCTARFRKEIEEARLTIVHAAVAHEAGVIPFYVNLDKDDWSSMSQRLGTRRQSRYERVLVEAMPFSECLRRYASGRRVYYIKADIEGGDVHVLNGLVDWPSKPKYVSVEAQHLSWLSQLYLLGYRRFKLVNQNLVWTLQQPNPPREGVLVTHKFSGYASGPFGEETPGVWRTFEETAELYLSLRRTQIENPGLLNAFFDFHAKRG